MFGFEMALALMKIGKNVRMASWSADFYLCILRPETENVMFPHVFLRGPNGLKRVYIPTAHELMDQEWEIAQ